MPNPVEGTGDFELTTCLVGFNPTAAEQQAGLICLDDEGNFIKWTYQWNEGRKRGVLAVFRETSGNSDARPYVYDVPHGDKLWLRLTKHGSLYGYSASQDGESFRMYGTLAWGDAAPSWLGLVALNAHKTAPELDAAFDFFEVNPQPTVAVPPPQPESSMTEDRSIYLQVRGLLAQQNFDEAAKRLADGLERFPDSASLWSQHYALYQYLTRVDRVADAIRHLQVYIDYLLPKSATNAQSMTVLARYVGQLMDAYVNEGHSEEAFKAIDRLIASAEQVAGVTPGAIESLVAQKALFLAKQAKPEEAFSIMEKQLAAAQKSMESSSKDPDAILRVATRLKDLVTLETTLESDKVSERRNALLEFLSARAKAQPAEQTIVTQYLQEYLSFAVSLCQTDPDQAEALVNGVQEFLETCLDEDARKQYARYNLDSIRRRIETARKLAALIGSPAVFPEAPDAWVNGGPLSPDDLKGKVVLLDFWAVWCGPCVSTFPHLREWREKYGEQGFEIIGITRYYKYDWDDDAGRIKRAPDLEPEKEREALKRFADHFELKHPFAVMADTSLQEHYVVTGIPHVVLIDRSGKVRFYRIGSGDQNAHEIEEMIETCLTQKPAESG